MDNGNIYTTKDILKEMCPVRKPIFPTLHLLSLPGAPFHRGRSMQEILDYTMGETETLIECGVDGFIVENHGDIPFPKPDEFPMETVAAMSVVGAEVCRMAKAKNMPVGVNCLANAGVAALAVAKAIGANFVRINQFVNAYVANEGFVEGRAGEILRYRKNIGGEGIAIFSDVHVKHGSHAIVADRPVAEQAKDALFFCSDALICTGHRTGDAPDCREIEEMRVSPCVPVLVGSGITLDNFERIFNLADGGIVASYFKKDGMWQNRVERDRCMRFMDAMRRYRAKMK